MHSLRAKLILPFVAGAIALTLLLTWYTYSSGRKAVESATLLISEAKTLHTTSSVNLLFRSMSTNLQNMVVDPRVLALFSSDESERAAHADVTEWLEIMTQSNEYYRDILIVDKNAVCIASSNPGHVGNSYADKSYVRLALDGMFSFGEPSVGRVTKRLSAVGAGPIDTADGIDGALVLMNDLPQIVDYDVTSVHDSQRIFTTILSFEGVFLAHKDPRLMGEAREEFRHLYESLKSVGEQGGAVQYELEGEVYRGYARLMPQESWLVITSGPESEIFVSAYQVGFMVLGMSIISLSIICFIVIRFANGILTSLISLIRYAKRVSEGDLDRQLGSATRQDELGELHNSLKRLVIVLQTMLRETQEANKMKGQFLANMSHEIRTPLNAIIGMAHLSLRDGGLPPRQVEYLGKIQLGAKSLLGLINDILDLSKVDAGMMDIERTELNLRSLLGDIVTLHQEGARAKGIELHLTYEDGAPEFFFGDPLRISQVVNNLVSNGMKFTKEGRVSIRCWQGNADEVNNGLEVPLGENGEPKTVMHISVTDSGIGMTESVIATLFKPFTQADASTSRQYGGTGLGLAISAKIVELLGGKISVTSVPGQGSTFSFYMQLEHNPGGHLEMTQDLPLDIAFEQLKLQGKHILVAEDNEINQMIIRELMSPSGADIEIADNGQIAVDLVKANDYDLILMDMQMPVMDGLEATRVIRSLKKGQDIPIIAVTANAMKESKDKGYASGMSDYLTKPIEPKELLQVLYTWLQGGKARQ